MLIHVENESGQLVYVGTPIEVKFFLDDLERKMSKTKTKTK